MATRAQAREEREKHLQRRVKTSLCLSPPDPPPQVCAPYTKSAEEQKASARLYKSKLRTNRLLQVRAQDALLATQRLAVFRDRKANESKNALNHLKMDHVCKRSRTFGERSSGDGSQAWRLSS